MSEAEAEEGGMAETRASFAFMEVAAVLGVDAVDGWILERHCCIICWKETFLGRTASVGQRRRMRCQCL